MNGEGVATCCNRSWCTKGQLNELLASHNSNHTIRLFLLLGKRQAVACCAPQSLECSRGKPQGMRLLGVSIVRPRLSGLSFTPLDHSQVASISERFWLISHQCKLLLPFCIFIPIWLSAWATSMCRFCYWVTVIGSSVITHEFVGDLLLWVWKFCSFMDIQVWLFVWFFVIVCTRLSI